MRDMLPNHRHSITVDILHPAVDPYRYAVGFGFDDAGRCREAFCQAFKSGSDLQQLLHHALIAISLGLQHGVSMAEFVRAMDEDTGAPPRSIIGAIVRMGARLDIEMAEQMAARK